MELLRAEKITLADQALVCPTKPEPSKLLPVESDHFWKPRNGGLWTSTLNDEGGEWLRWLANAGYSLEQETWGGRLWRLTPRETTVYMVWSPRELRELFERFPHPDVEEINAGYRERGGEGDFYLWIDWEKMALDYDAIHIPNPWPWRFSEDHAASMFFYSMDAECTCWFRWCFEDDPSNSIQSRSSPS